MKKLFKGKMKKIISILLVIVTSMFFISNSYASYVVLNGGETSDWKVKITSNQKKIEETKKIDFTVMNDSNVVRGKIAPGGKATANIEIDLTGTKVPVDIKVEVDDYSLKEAFKLTTKLDGEKYETGTIKTIELDNNQAFTRENGQKKIELELEWINTSNDNTIGNYSGGVSIPIKVIVKQHI